MDEALAAFKALISDVPAAKGACCLLIANATTVKQVLVGCLMERDMRRPVYLARLCCEESDDRVYLRDRPTALC